MMSFTSVRPPSRPSPRHQAFERIIAAHAITPKTTAFFEDAAHNLEPAAALGMTTVLVGLGAGACEAPYIDHRAENLAAFLAAARIKEAP